jgi:hypothetical protein
MKCYIREVYGSVSIFNHKTRVLYILINLNYAYYLYPKCDKILVGSIFWRFGGVLLRIAVLKPGPGRR